MKKSLSYLSGAGMALLAFVLILGASSQPQSFCYSHGERYSLGLSTEKISIKFQTGVTAEQIQSLLANEPVLDQLKAMPQASAQGFYAITLRSNVAVTQLLTRLRQRSEVAMVNPVYLANGLEGVPYDRFVVQFKPEVASAQIEALNSKHQVEVVNISTAVPNLYTLRVTAASDLAVLEMANLYYESLSCEYALPDFIVPAQLFSAPNDPHYADQYYLNNTGQSGGVADADIDAAEAWDVSTGSSSILLAVIDAGGTSHEDLPASRIVLGLDYINFDSDPSADGNEAHGMACAGIITASQNNSTGISGVAPNCKVIHQKIFDAKGNPATTANIASAITDAWQQLGADVINISWGYPTSDPNHPFLTTIRSAIDNALTQGRNGKGCVVIAGAGNTAERSNNNLGYVAFPANAPGVLAVGALNKSNQYHDFSPNDAELAVVVPSGNMFVADDAIPSCSGQPHNRFIMQGDMWTLDMTGQPGYADGNYNICPPNNFNEYTPHIATEQNYSSAFGGTSAAAATTSGVAALILSVNSNLTATQVQDVIKQSADDMGAAGYDQDFGYGRVNAYEALLLALAYGNQTMSNFATSYNTGRHLVKDGTGKYHLVFESGIQAIDPSDGINKYFNEIFYRNSTDGVNWSAPIRLSDGNDYNRFPCITERSGQLYVVWQRQTTFSGASFNYEIRYAYSGDAGASWTNNYALASSISSANDPLPVIQAGATGTNTLMVVFRTGTNLTSRYVNNSNPNVGDWATYQVSSGSGLRNPSLAYRSNETPYRFQVTYDTGVNVFYRKFNENTLAWGSQSNVSSGLGTSANSHQWSSYTIAADYSRHVTWHANEPLGGNVTRKVVYHNRNLSSSIYTKFYGTNLDYQFVSAAGMSGGAVVLFWHDLNASNNRNVRSAFYDGSCWDTFPNGGVVTNNALYAATAVSNPPSSSTRAVWRNSGNAPYALGLSATVNSDGSVCSQALPKVVGGSQGNDDIVYSRQLLFMLDSTAVLAVRLFAPEITGESLSLDFPQVAESDSLTAATLFDKLRFDFAIPANAEELKLHAEAFALNAGRLLQNGRSSLQPGFEILDQNNRRLALVEAGELTLQGEFKLTKTLTVPIAALRGKTVRLRPVLSNLDLNRVRGTLVHAYGPQDIGAQTNAGQPAPLAQHETASLVAAHPNPFNPSTQIRFLMPQAGLAALRLFNTNGQLVRELLHEERNAGEYVVTWNGRNENGEQAASGVYFIHFEGAGQKQVSKLTLMR